VESGDLALNRKKDGLMKKKGRVGTSFDDFLKEEGIYEEVTARAIKRVIAGQLDTLMEAEGITKSELAKRMKTSRAHLDRLLDPDNESVTLAPSPAPPTRSAGSSRWSWCRRAMPLSRFEFDWDPAKATANVAKHGVAFGLAMTVFLDPLARSRFDEENSDEESRWVTLGEPGMDD